MLAACHPDVDPSGRLKPFLSTGFDLSSLKCLPYLPNQQSSAWGHGLGWLVEQDSSRWCEDSEEWYDEEYWHAEEYDDTDDEGSEDEDLDDEDSDEEYYDDKGSHEEYSDDENSDDESRQRDRQVRRRHKWKLRTAARAKVARLKLEPRHPPPPSNQDFSRWNSFGA